MPEMAQTPNVIGITVMQRLKETGEPATPENYERYYYEISGLPRPEKAVVADPVDVAEPAAVPAVEQHAPPGAAFCAECWACCGRCCRK
jgi:hypothetical protein